MPAGLRRRFASVLAALYLALHIPFLAPSLEDIDSINFALGLREFDVARHQPHPPGYPVFIALGRASLAAIDLAAPGLDRVRAEALALALWSALAGALAIVAAHALYRALAAAGGTAGRDGSAGPIATVLLALAPSFWLSGLRPMSDLAGLAFALGAQAMMVAGLHAPRFLVPASIVAALAIGVRVQTVWLTAPLLVAVLVLRHRARDPRGSSGGGRSATGESAPADEPASSPHPELAPAETRAAAAKPLTLLWHIGAAWAVGIAVWAFPLVVASGGPARYWQALGTQAGEDFAWVDMLWANPAPRRVAFALYETFVMPWGSIVLAAGVGAAAVAGAIVLMRQQRRALVLMAAAFVPYAVFHLLFQETRHVRYALPLVPAVAWLAASGVGGARRSAPILGAALCAGAAWVALPGMVAYGTEPHPAFRAIAAMADVPADERPATVFSHFSLRRPLQAAALAHFSVVEPPRTNEWTGVIDYWRADGTAPVWFLADPLRTDLAVIDPQARRDVRRYRWRPADRLELSGVRPLGVDWYRLENPGWFVGEGWSLTPELGGMTRVAGTGVDRRPIEAFVRRRGDAMVALVGARHLGPPSDEAVEFALAIDGRPVGTWTLDPADGPNVVRVFDIPAGALHGEGTYARLVVTARSSVAGRPTPAVAVRQFDIQPATGLVFAFDDGWHEDEYDNTTGLRWRWSSGRSVLRIVPPQAVRVRLRGESPLAYQSVAPAVRARARARIVAETRPADDFEWTFDVTRADALASDGRIAIETEPVYLPGVAEGTVDTRQLGLRLFEIDVIPSRRD